MKIAFELSDLTDAQSERLLATVQGAVTETIADDTVIEHTRSVGIDAALEDPFAILERLSQRASRAARTLLGEDPDADTQAPTDDGRRAEDLAAGYDDDIDTEEPAAVKCGRHWLAQRSDLTSTPTVPTVRLEDAIDAIEGLIDLYDKQTED